MESIIITTIVWLLILFGIIGTIVPVLPGTGLVFGGILLYALYFGVETVGMTTLILLGVVAALSFVLDLLASLYGASRLGASKSGLWGSAVGGLLGLLFLSLPGLLLGVFVGAIFGEYFLAKKTGEAALKSGIGSVLGFLGGTVLKLILSLAMTVVFAAKIWL